jgi:DNA-binding transcriptional ArsR family regulator
MLIKKDRPAKGTVFRAVSDPTRRAILDMLSESDRTAQELTASFSISQPAVSQHLRELREARLVRATRSGLNRKYTLTPEPLEAVVEWTRRYQRFFDPSGHAWQFTSVSAVKPQPATERGDAGKISAKQRKK